MNKKIFLIPLIIGLAIWIVLNIFEKSKTCEDFEMTVPELSREASVKNKRRISVYLDNSGSM